MELRAKSYSVFSPGILVSPCIIIDEANEKVVVISRATSPLGAENEL